MAQTLRRITALDRQHIWVLGDGGTLLTGNGASWTLVDAGVSQNLNDVLVTGPDEMWLAGDRGTLLHYLEGAWQVEETGTFVDLKAIASDGDGGFWLAGSGGSLLAWSLPTATPTSPPPPTPSPTPIETPSPGPSPSPPPEPWYDLQLADDQLLPGDPFRLDRQCGNPGPLPLAVDEYIILDVLGSYWFHPSWSQTVDSRPWTASAGQSYEETILEFVWPAGAGSLDGLRFWGAFLAAGSGGDLLAWDMEAWSFAE